MLSMLPVATGHSCRGFPLTNRAWTKSSSFVTKQPPVCASSIR